MNTDIIVSAHTHTPEIRYGSPMYVNPGECCGWLNGKSTVMVMEIDTLKVDIIDLSEVSLDDS